jgi:ADP-ribose pyrophosphatase YjhB (NUDIX family)
MENQVKQPLSPSQQFPLVTVGALVVDMNGRILIVKTTKWQGTWGVPGGKVDWGEPLESALIREFKEEVGLDITNVKFALLQEAILDKQFIRPAHFVMVNYFASTQETTITPNEEILEWAWLRPEEAFQYPLNGYTLILIEDYLSKQRMAEDPNL